MKNYAHFSKQYWDLFSDDEKTACIEWVAETLKNHIYMTAIDKSEEALIQLAGMTLGQHDLIEINFEINFVINDLLVVVGGMRRKNENQT